MASVFVPGGRGRDGRAPAVLRAFVLLPPSTPVLLRRAELRLRMEQAMDSAETVMGCVPHGLHRDEWPNRLAALRLLHH